METKLVVLNMEEYCMRNKTYFKYLDASHGWVAVKRSMLRDLNLLDKISYYSYQKGGTVYLEQDSDALKFCIAFKEKYGREPLIKEKSYTWTKNHIIRSYALFSND